MNVRVTNGSDERNRNMDEVAGYTELTQAGAAEILPMQVVGRLPTLLPYDVPEEAGEQDPACEQRLERPVDVVLSLIAPNKELRHGRIVSRDMVRSIELV